MPLLSFLGTFMAQVVPYWVIEAFCLSILAESRLL